jgi:hypothetical protein
MLGFSFNLFLLEPAGREKLQRAGGAAAEDAGR